MRVYDTLDQARDDRPYAHANPFQHCDLPVYTRVYEVDYYDPFKHTIRRTFSEGVDWKHAAKRFIRSCHNYLRERHYRLSSRRYVIVAVTDVTVPMTQGEPKLIHRRGQWLIVNTAVITAQRPQPGAGARRVK